MRLLTHEPSLISVQDGRERGGDRRQFLQDLGGMSIGAMATLLSVSHADAGNDEPALAEFPLNKISYDETSASRGKLLGRFLESGAYQAALGTLRLGISRLEQSDYTTRETEHRIVQGKITELIRCVNPLPQEILNLLEEDSWQKIIQQSEAPLEFRQRLEKLRHYALKLMMQGSEKMPPGKISAMTALNELRKLTGFTIQIRDEASIWEISKDPIIVQHGYNSWLNVLGEIIARGRHTVEFGDDAATLVIVKKKNGDPEVVGVGHLIGRFDDRSSMQLRHTPHLGATVLSDQDQVCSCGYMLKTTGFSLPPKKEEKKRVENEMHARAELPPLPLRPPISKAWETLTIPMRIAHGPISGTCLFERESNRVGSQDIRMIKEQVGGGWEVTISATMHANTEDGDYLSEATVVAAAEQNRYFGISATGREFPLRAMHGGRQNDAAVGHFFSPVEPVSVTAKTYSSITPPFEVKIPTAPIEIARNEL